ncbi:MAG: recombinase family protein [Actinomycetota bacterium]|nr:recombinase family protein [Actinomycetota bacterium]
MDRQRDDCLELAERLGWQVVGHHSDNDLSAYSGKPRPGYQALLADIQHQRADAVLVWHTDRLHRRPTELEDCITIRDKYGVITQTVKAGPLDLANPVGPHGRPATGGRCPVRGRARDRAHAARQTAGRDEWSVEGRASAVRLRGRRSDRP